MQSYVATPLSRSNIKSITKKIRDMLGLTNTIWFPIVEFLELVMPQIDPEFVLDIQTYDELGEYHGLTYPDEHKIIIREDVYKRAISGVGRDRLTIAHEIGHYLLHKKGAVVLARGSGEELPAYKDPEWQATAFAGELLVPSCLVRGMNVTRVTECCGVSYSAARKQLKHC
jgi:Zn-dependent peptidase ImmA (M78 family)